MKHLVVGTGEVGGPLRDLLGADGYDVRWHQTTESHYDVLHIAFGYSDTFLPHVHSYIDRWTPGLTIIHSTVPIGTTKQIPGAVHSPVNGRHGSMLEDLKRIPKWFGGPRAPEAAQLWPTPLIHCTENSDHTEALKLICLMKYGAALAAAFYADDIAQQIGLDEEALLTWDCAYNASVRPVRLKRPLIARETTAIGGHCVIPGIKHLQRTHPHPLLAGVLEYE